MEAVKTKAFRFQKRDYTLEARGVGTRDSEWTLRVEGNTVAVGCFGFGMLDTEDTLPEALAERVENILLAMHGDPNTDED